MHLSYCPTRAFQNPWNSSLKIYRESLRTGADAAAKEGLTDTDLSRLRTDYGKVNDAGGSSFEIADHTLNKEAKKKEAFLTQALQRFQAKTGIDERKYIEKVNDAKNMSELLALESQFKKAGIKYYEQQLKRSGLFVPMDPREAGFVAREERMYLDWIKTQPLDTKDSDEPSIIEALGDLPEHLEDRREGRQRLKEQSSYVKDEYFRLLGSMAADGSKEKLLDKVLKSIGDLEKEPSTIQAEFKKLAKKTKSGNKSTEELLTTVKTEYQKRTDEYNALLEEDADYFGGKEVNTPKGKMREARKEFEDWFADLHSFSQMEDMRKRLLDTVLPERKAVYKEREELLAMLPPGKQKQLREKTNEMRFHTLKAYLKETKEKNLRESIYALEYVAKLETAEYNGYPLFDPSEKQELTRVIQRSNAELQEAELKVLLGRMIPEREELVKNYLELDEHLKDEHRFFSVNIYEKRKLLREANEKKDRELQNPFDIDNLTSLDQEDRLSLLLTKLYSQEGGQAIHNVRKDLSAEGKTQRSETQMKVMGVMSGEWKQMKSEGATQAENYMNSIYEGARVNNKHLWKAAWEDGEAKDDNQKYMAETAKTDYHAYLAGKARTWGGNIVNVGKVNKKEFERGDNSMLEKLETALYPENMLFLNAEGQDELRPDKMAKEVLGNSLKEEVLQMYAKLGLKVESLPRGFKEALIHVAIIAEHGGLFSRMDQGANNTDHFIDEIAA